MIKYCIQCKIETKFVIQGRRLKKSGELKPFYICQECRNRKQRIKRGSKSDYEDLDIYIKDQKIDCECRCDNTWKYAG